MAPITAPVEPVGAVLLGVAIPQGGASCRTASCGQARKVVTHCPHGHEYTEFNSKYGVRIDGKRYRYCRECNRLRARNKAREHSSPATKER